MTLGQAANQFAEMIRQARYTIGRALTDLSIAITNGVAGMRLAFISMAEAIADALPRGVGGGMADTAALARENTEKWRAEQRAIAEAAFLRQVTTEIYPSSKVTDADKARAAGNASATVDAEEQMSKDRLDTIQNWADSVQRLERDTAQQRVDVTRQYEQQRADVIAQYQLSLVRETQDFARQRLRQEQQLQRSIEDVRANAAEREADWWANLQDRINDLPRRLYQAPDGHGREIQPAARALRA